MIHMHRFFPMLLFFLTVDLFTKRYFEVHYDVEETRIVSPE